MLNPFCASFNYTGNDCEVMSVRIVGIVVALGAQHNKTENEELEVWSAKLHMLTLGQFVDRDKISNRTL